MVVREIDVQYKNNTYDRIICVHIANALTLQQREYFSNPFMYSYLLEGLKTETIMEHVSSDYYERLMLHPTNQ